MADTVLENVKRASGWSIVLGILMILAGMLAIISPLFAGVMVVYIVAWTAIFNGGVQIVYGFRAHSGGKMILEILLGLLYIAAGVFILMHPGSGLLALTLVIACFLLIYGVFALVLAFQLRPNAGWGWVLIRRYHHHSAGRAHMGALADQFRMDRRHVARHQLRRLGRIASDVVVCSAEVSVQSRLTPTSEGRGRVADESGGGPVWRPEIA